MKRLDIVWMPGHQSLFVYGSYLYGTKGVCFPWTLAASRGVPWCMDFLVHEFGFRDSQVERALEELVKNCSERRFDRVTSELYPVQEATKEELLEIIRKRKNGTDKNPLVSR